jgi:3-phenylpropionate/trans-cinnamate dioxygenase ferredoxin reductase component
VSGERKGLVVVGGGPAALETVRAFREAGGAGPVSVVSVDVHPPYNRPPLTKDYLRGESKADDLPLEDDGFYADHDIDLRLRTRVLRLDPAARAVQLDDGTTMGFTTCVLATGSSPVPLPVPGADHPEVLYLRSRVQGELLRRRAEEARSAVVVGSGFIGCEAAASLAARGLDVVMVSREARPQQGRLGHCVAERISGWLEGAGVRVLGDAEVGAIHDGRTVELTDGSHHPADLVLVAAGVQQHAELAEQCGIACQDGRILTDASMRTDAEGVLAAGDVAAAFNAAAGRRLVVEHWGEALRMGEIAGSVAAGQEDSWAQAPGFWSDIGERMLKYAAWGDGYDETRLVEHGDEAFTVWYARDGVVVGVLTHDADDDYDRGQALVERGAAFPPEGS